MSRAQLLQLLVRERLTAAAEEILAAVTKSVAGYEEELRLCRLEIRRLRQADARSPSPEAQTEEAQLSVPDSDAPDRQEKEGRCESEWSSGQDADGPACTTKEEREENEAFLVIISPPYVKSKLDRLQADSPSPAGGADPQPGSSVQQVEVEIEDGDVASPGVNSDEEWTFESEACDDQPQRKKKRRKRRATAASMFHLSLNNKSRISCKVCGKAFHANVSLVNHMAAHPRDLCGVCGQRFDDDEDGFLLHLKTHVSGEVCGVCGKCFGGARSLEMHMRVHTGEKPFVCGECGKSFNCRHNMMRHMRIHTGEKPYTCSVCQRSFNDYSTLKRHLRVHVADGSLEAPVGGDAGAGKPPPPIATPRKQPPRAMCEVCGKTFHSNISLLNHAKQHAADACGVCGTHFDTEEELILHLTTHANGKVCRLCGKCFDSQKNLDMHTRTHTGEKPFLCSECGKSFNCRHNMSRHMRIHTGEKPYACGVCDRRFSDHTSLKQHSSLHGADKPHCCHVCGKGFHRVTRLKAHMRNHPDLGSQGGPAS
ncbi:zinc finger protein OZF-like [Salarias fasciatus]|uniref:Zinc finger protein OZF-like n=1 Tax=Salarias fasciatus TaxID=181472 RepID=A0A672FHZ2_SALFA|nr:zinc finger protein OZF-like [Salarias fasciatus]